MSVPVYLAAVPWDRQRAVCAGALRQEIGPERVTVTWDEKQDAWDTFVRNLQAAGAGPAIFIEDDIILTTNWAEKIDAAITAHPDVLIQFYSNRDADLSVGSRWEPGKSFLNLQCWYAPLGMPPKIVDYLSTWPDRATDPTGTDLALAQFLRDEGLKYWLYAPSLVQHRAWKSAINPRRPFGVMRQSKSFQE